MDGRRTLRLLAALLLLAGGAIHLSLNLDGYGTDAILTAFALNAAASAVVAAYLVLRDDVVGPLAGIGVSVGSLVALGLSRRGDGLLDFREVGWHPSPQVALTVGAEVGAALLLVALLVRGVDRRMA